MKQESNVVTIQVEDVSEVGCQNAVFGQILSVLAPSYHWNAKIAGFWARTRRSKVGKADGLFWTAQSILPPCPNDGEHIIKRNRHLSSGRLRYHRLGFIDDTFIKWG